MRVQLIFDNDAIFDWHLYSNDFVVRWYDLLKTHVEQVPEKHTYELTVAGVGKDNPFERLLDILYKINDHAPNTIPSNYLKLSFTLDELSELHYIYEEIGKDESWLKGNLPEKDAIKYRDLFNDYIHQSESKAGEKEEIPRTRFRIVNPETGVPNAQKIDFQDHDYELFDPIIYPNVMYLNYNAVGEDYIKTFKSGRSPADAVPLRKYSPSFFFVTHSVDFDIQSRRINDCLQWMNNGGVDIHNPKNSFGYIPMGSLFKTKSDAYYLDALANSQIKEVILK